MVLEYSFRLHLQVPELDFFFRIVFFSAKKVSGAEKSPRGEIANFGPKNRISGVRVTKIGASAAQNNPHFIHFEKQIPLSTCVEPPKISPAAPTRGKIPSTWTSKPKNFRLLRLQGVKSS